MQRAILLVQMRGSTPGISPLVFPYANVEIFVIIIKAEWLNSVTLFEAEYLQNEYCIYVILFFNSQGRSDPKPSEVQGNFVLYMQHLNCVTNSFLSTDISSVRTFPPDELNLFSHITNTAHTGNSHYDHL